MWNLPVVLVKSKPVGSSNTAQIREFQAFKQSEAKEVNEK